MEAIAIKTEKEYKQVLELIETLIDCPENSEEEAKLEALSLLVESYEEENYPIEPSHPVEVIKFKMVQMGLKPNDLIQYIGSRSLVSRVLNYQKPLSLNMIRRLSKGLNLPADILIQEYELTDSA